MYGKSFADVVLEKLSAAKNKETVRNASGNLGLEFALRPAASIDSSCSTEVELLPCNQEVVS